MLDYYGVGPTQAEIDLLSPDPTFEKNGRIDGEVNWVAAHVYDKWYKGPGIWPNNTGLASERGLDSTVCQLRSLQDVETLVVNYESPVTISFPWKPGDMPASMLPESNGHLLVIIGFDENGDVVVNDSATLDDRHENVQKTLPRDAVEKQWLLEADGMAYVTLRL